MTTTHTQPAGCDLDSLTRYDLFETDDGDELRVEPDGRWVRFDDVREAAARAAQAPQIGQAGATGALDSAARDKLYIEARDCGACGHVGLNDASETLAACSNCDWSGPRPTEDHCPGCAEKGCMTAACPKCGWQYRFLADAEIARPARAAQAPQVGQDALTDAQISAGADVLCDCPKPKRIGRNAAIDVFHAMTAAGAQIEQQAAQAPQGDTRQGATVDLSNADLYTLRRVIECVEKMDERPRPMCRDCADENGTCPNSGLECDMGMLITSAKSIYNRLATPAAHTCTPADERALPPLPAQHDELRARWKCEDCDGTGEVGDLIDLGDFQPPERARCSNCDGAGQVPIAAYTDDQMREYARAAQGAGTAPVALEPVEGDLLPPVGSKVLIHLARQDAWVEHTVSGYYVWGALRHQVREGEKHAHRVFVRVKDANGYDNARLLSEVQPATHPAPVCTAAATNQGEKA